MTASSKRVKSRAQKIGQWGLAVVAIAALVLPMLSSGRALAAGPYWGYGETHTGTGSWGSDHANDWPMNVPDDYWGVVWANPGATATWTISFYGSHSDVNAIDLMGCHGGGALDLYAYDETLTAWQLVQASVSDCSDATTNLSTSTHHYYQLPNPGDEYFYVEFRLGSDTSIWLNAIALTTYGSFPTATPTVSATAPPATSPAATSVPPAGGGTYGGMYTHNFWYWVLQSINDFLFTYFLPFIPRHVNWGLVDVVARYAGPILLIFYLSVGSFVHLATLFRIVQLLIVMETIKGIFAVRALIAKFVKWATIIGALS